MLFRSLKCVQRFEKSGITWPIPDNITDRELEVALYQNSRISQPMTNFAIPNWSNIHQELKKKGVTRQLLWEEYFEQHPESLSYSQFCHHYRSWLKSQRISMHQNHKGGEKLFVDYAGKTIAIHCPLTGQVQQAQVFVAVWGASNFTYAEATLTQQTPDWIGSHVRAFEFFGCTPEILVPDNLKSGVQKACLYDPEVNP